MMMNGMGSLLLGILGLVGETTHIILSVRCGKCMVKVHGAMRAQRKGMNQLAFTDSQTAPTLLAENNQHLFTS